MSRMSLKNVTSGRVVGPLRILMFGVPGVGKSTFGAHAPSPIFLGEDGSGELDVYRFPQPNTWQDVLDALSDLMSGQHDRQTLVIDTIDWLEPLCWEHVCKAKGKAHIEDFGYKTGYDFAADEWRELLRRLDMLRSERRMSVILLGHSRVRTFKNPDGESGYDRYELRLHQKSGDLLKDWAQAVLFARHETTTKEGKDKRVRGLGTGYRMMHTEMRPAWDAKNRFRLPENMPLSWDDFHEAVKAFGRLEEGLREADSLLARVDPETASKARSWLAGGQGKDPVRVAELVNKLRAKVQPTEETAK